MLTDVTVTAVNAPVCWLQVIASRKELVEYDRQQREAATAAAAALPSSTPATPLHMSMSSENLFGSKAEEVPGCSSQGQHSDK